MPRTAWPLVSGRPIVQVSLVSGTGQIETLDLLADTGAGSVDSPFEILLDEQTCLMFGGSPGQSVKLRGAYQGSFPVYVVRAKIPSLDFEQYIRAVAVASVPHELRGIACFRLLNRFAFGNFGDGNQFGLEA